MWEVIAVEAALWAGAYALNWYFREDPPKPQPKHDLQNRPRTVEGEPVPLIYGKVRVDSPMLIWRSDLENRTVTASGGFEQFNYYIDLFFALGLPMAYPSDTTLSRPVLHRMWIDDTLVPWSLVTTSTTGGAGGALTGGRVGQFTSTQVDRTFAGRISFYDGANMATNFPTAGLGIYSPGIGPLALQTLNSNLSNTDPNRTWIADAVDSQGDDLTLFPSCRSMLTVALTGNGTRMAIGTTPSLPSFSFEVSHYGPRAFTTDDFDFGLDASPIEVIYDLLTNTWGRLGLATSRIDTVSFAAANTTLKAEGHGFSRAIYDRNDVTPILAEICNQIDAALYVEPSTGQFKIKLIRNDYVVASILQFTDALENIVSIKDYSLGAWRETYNKVEVRYTDRDADYKQGSAVAHNLANTTGQDNTFRTQVIDFPGVSNGTLAKKIAARELHVASQPLAKISIVVNRDGLTIRPGDPFLVTYAEYGLNTVFRCTRVDFGDLFDNRITISGVQDAWDNAGAGLGDGPTGIFNLPVPYPTRERVFFESPRWLQVLAENEGWIGSPDVQHVMSLAVPDYQATRTAVNTRKQDLVFQFTFDPDVPAQGQMPSYATVATSYARTLEPYDTTTGLVIQDCTGPLFSLYNFAAMTASQTQIATEGRLMICVVTNGKAEFMCFESVTALGGGQYRLNNVWRAVMDKPAIAHAVGSRVYFVDAQWSTGRRAFSVIGTIVDGKVLGKNQYYLGSGVDPVDTITTQGRHLLPLYPTDVCVVGESPFEAGTVGVPSAGAGFFKRVTFHDEGFYFFGRRRERTHVLLRRGDTTDDTMIDPVIYLPVGRKIAGDNLPDFDNDDGGFTALDGAIAGAPIDGSQNGMKFLRVGPQGHGEIEVALVPNYLSPPNGSGNGSVLYAYDRGSAVRVQLTAYRWRNLIANARFGSVSLGAWTQTVGTTTVATSANSLKRVLTDYYATGTAASNPETFTQTIDVSGYRPEGLRATLWFFHRMFNLDPNDTITVDIAALNSGLTVLSSTSTGAIVPASTSWTKQKITLNPLPALTKYIRITVTLTGVSDTTPDVACTDFSLRIGQFVDAQLLNDNFESGTFTSWTNAVNSFVAYATAPLIGTNSAQGGPFATSEISQTATIPVGFTYGTAVLDCWRLTAIAADTGNIIMEVLNGASAVIATTSTGVETTATGEWFKRLLWIDLPLGAVSVRVRLVANRAAGAGNSGAVFDATDLQFHKTLDSSPAYAFDFSYPAKQPMPTTWQDFYIDHPTMDAPAPYVFGGDSQWLPGEMRWSDGGAYESAKAIGFWDARNGITSVNAYRFTRQSGGSALCIQANGVDIQWLGDYDNTEDFTAVVIFRVDEIGFSSACGLIGRMDLTSGWQLGIDASGNLFAQAKGPGGTVTATRASTTVADGAWHLAAISYEAATNTLRVYDERGVDSVSTVAAGNFAGVGSSTCRFRVGRGSTSDNTLPGLIARVYMFDDLRDSPDIWALWTYGGDPTRGLMAVGSDYIGRTVAGWIDAPDDADGATLACMAFDQLPVAYDASLTTDGGSGYGFALQRAHTNLIQSFDLTSASWPLVGSPTRTTGIEDMTGKLAGATYVVTTTDFVRTIGLPMTATATLNLVCWMYASTATNLTLELINASNVLKNSQAIVLGVGWQKVRVQFSGWDNSTATARINFRSTAGSATFTLGHVAWAAQGIGYPTIIPPAATAHVEGYIASQNAFTYQYNQEGEIDVVGLTPDSTTPATTLGIASAINLVNDNDSRALVATSSTGVLRHYNGTGVQTDSATLTVDWSQIWRLRGRWNTAGLLSPETGYGGAKVDGSSSSSTYSVAASFTTTTTATSQFIGYDAKTPQLTALLRSVRFCTREQKLP